MEDLYEGHARTIRTENEGKWLKWMWSPGISLREERFTKPKDVLCRHFLIQYCPLCSELPFMSDDFDATVTAVNSEWMSHTSSSREGKAAKYSFISGLAGSAMASTDRQPSTVPNTMFLPSSVLSIALSSACIRKLAIIFASEVL